MEVRALHLYPFDIGVPPRQISFFAGLEWLKISFLSQIFNTNQNLSGFCQVSSFEDPELPKMLILSQIFKATQNFWI